MKRKETEGVLNNEEVTYIDEVEKLNGREELRSRDGKLL